MAIARAGGVPAISVIGGAEIFALFLPLATRIELTEVQVEAAGDTVMPPFSPAMWRETAREAHAPEDGRPGYSFVTLARRGAWRRFFSRRSVPIDPAHGTSERHRAHCRPTSRRRDCAGQFRRLDRKSVVEG